MTYLDSFTVTPGARGLFFRVVTHSWEADARARLAWLYGDPDERIEATAADRAAWRRLGGVSARESAA